jgi:hypothetical protein
VPKLSDNQIGHCLYAALEAIGTDEGETIRGNTALVAARQIAWADVSNTSGGTGQNKCLSYCDRQVTRCLIRAHDAALGSMVHGC